MTRPTTTGKAQDLITFTRSTTGTYLGSDGLLKSAAIDEARIEYDASGNCLGLLVEEGRTNKVLYSEDFTHSSWLKQDVTVAPAPVAAPDGTMAATHVVKAGNNAHLVSVNIGSTADRSSIWARTVSGTGTMYIGGTDASTLVTVTEEWQKLDAQSVNVHMYAANLRAGATLTEVYVWGAQLETGSFPTSYIPTSGSVVTRAADVASLAVSEFGYNQDQGSVVVDFIPTDHPSSTYNQLIVSANASKRWVYFNDTATYSVAGFDGTNQIAITNVLAPIKAAIGLSSTQGSIAANGDASANSTDVAHNGNILTSTSFDIAANTTAHIKSVQYYPLRLSNAQLQALTV